MNRRRKTLLAVAGILGIAILISVVHHYQLKAAVTRFRVELRAKGVPMDLSHALPPGVPAEQNGASLLLRAFSLMTTNGVLETNPPPSMRMVALGKAMVGAVQPEIRDNKVTNSWENEQNAIDENNAALVLLYEVVTLPKVDFQFPYEKGFCDANSFTKLHLIEFKKAGKLLTFAAMTDLHRGRAGAAVKNVRSAILLSTALQDQRLVISELVRIAILAYAQTVSWEILQSDFVTDADLAALQHEWERLDFIRGYKDAIVMERLCGDFTLAQWRNSNVELQKCLGMGKAVRNAMGEEDDVAPSFFQNAKLSAQIFMWRYWWSYPDELRSLQGSEALIQTVNDVMTNGAFVPAFARQHNRLEALGISNLGSGLEALFSENPDFHSMLSQSIQTLGNCFKNVTQAETMKRMTVTAIALKRFQLEYGNYPTQLSELAPKFLASVPLDPANGKTLSYRVYPDGKFLFYSIGEDGVDDGGNPHPADKNSSSLSWQRGRDWVWPQPATAEEIRAWEVNRQRSDSLELLRCSNSSDYRLSKVLTCRSKTLFCVKPMCLLAMRPSRSTRKVVGME